MENCKMITDVNDYRNVFNRLYQNAVSLRLKKDFKEREACYQSKQLSLQATQNNTTRYHRFHQRHQSQTVDALSDDFLERALNQDAERVREVLDKAEKKSEFAYCTSSYEKNIRKLISTAIGEKQRISKRDLIEVMTALGIKVDDRNASLSEKQTLLFDELWSYLRLQSSCATREVDTDIANEVLSILLNPTLTITQQSALLANS
jgi:predicted ATP-binding protein involved in virulence